MSLYAKKFFKRENQEAAESLIKEAIADITEEIYKADDLDDEIKIDVMSNLQKVLIIAGYPQVTVYASRMEQLYKEVDRNVDEEILETTIDLIKYNNKINNEPKASWMSAVNRLTLLNNLKFVIDENVLYVPPEYIQYPYFDPNRSRFFNTATLYTEVALTLNEGIKEYIKMVRFVISFIRHPTIDFLLQKL